MTIYASYPFELGSSGSSGVTSLNGETGAVTLIAGTGITITPSGSNITIASTDQSTLTFVDSLINSGGTVSLVNDSTSPTANQYYGTNGSSVRGYYNLPSPGTGTVTAVSVISANGFAGTVANSTTTPAITLSTTITGLLQGNGTSISAYTGGNLTDSTSGADGITITSGTGAVIGSGTSIAQAAASASQNGYLSSTNFSTFNSKLTSTLASGDIFIGNGSNVATAVPMSGDATLANTGAITLATVNSSPGTYTNASITVNAKGLITLASTGTTAITTLGAFDSAPNANGAVISGTTLTLEPASASFPGGLSTTTQSWAGNKTNVGTFAVTPGGSTTALTIDSTAFVFDSTNDAFGIGIQPSTATLIDMVNTSGASKPIQVTQYGFNSAFRGRYANGTIGAPTSAVSGNILAAFSGRGYGTSQFAAASTGVMNVVAGETFTNTSNATYLQFEVTPTGSVTVAEAMRLNSTGNLLIGTTTDSGTQKLQVNGNSNVGTVTTGKWNGTSNYYVTFLTSGTSWTSPSTISGNSNTKITLIGGGGGGGGCSASIDATAAGGGAGGTAIILLAGTIAASTAYTIAIGSGGIGNSGAVGNSGGNTTITIGATTYTASGGNGGNNGVGQGSPGGSTTNATIGITGQAGGSTGAAVATSSTSGGGGSSMYGLGGATLSENTTTTTGLAGTGYGAGGGGARGGTTGSAAPGGQGSPGGILIEIWN